MNRIRLIVVDDHKLIIDGIRSLLDGADGIEIMASASNGKELLEKLNHLQPDIVLMDMDMPVMNGYDATREALKRYPDLKIIALTMHAEKALVTKMMEAGAKAYLLKNTGKEELIFALKTVMEEKNFFSPELMLNLVNNRQENTSQLSEREVEVLKLVAQGMSATEIGAKLFISPRTVETHRNHIMQKLEVSNLAGLIRQALKLGIID